MVKALVIYILLLLCPLSALALPTLEVQLNKPVGELGRPVYIKIIGDELTSDLSLLSLNELNEQFFLDTKDLYSEILKPGDTAGKRLSSDSIRRQTLSLKLYPRQTGNLLIPSFNIDKLSSTEKTLIISNASSHGEGIDLEWKLTSSEVWQREQIILSLTLTTPEQYANVKLAKQTLDGFEITPLPVNREWIENDKGGRSIITTGWSLLPLAAGLKEISLPAIEYHLSGVIRRTFYLPKIKITVQALASYMPPTIAVGKVRIESSVSPSGMLNKDNLAYWNISIESESLTPYWLPAILRQIRSDENIQFYPAASKRSMQPDNTGVHGRVTHVIPFKPLNNGYIDLPKLKLQYFDPLTGKLESVEHKAERQVSTGILLRVLILIVLGSVALYILKILYRFSRNRIEYRKQHRHALNIIQQAKTKEKLLTGLRLMGVAEGWPANLTLSDWLKRWQIKYQTEPGLEECIQVLSDSCYGREKEYSIQEMISGLSARLKTARKA